MEEQKDWRVYKMEELKDILRLYEKYSKSPPTAKGKIESIRAEIARRGEPAVF